MTTAKKPSKTDIAYLAGLIDGDGSVGIMRNKRARQSHGLYHPYIKVSGINEAMMWWAHIHFGGAWNSNYPPSLKNRGYRQQYAVMWSYRKAMGIAKITLPHLIDKRRRAEIVVEWYENGASPLGGRGRWHLPAYQRRQEKLWTEMRSLQSRKGAPHTIPFKEGVL
jgi:hypothetical protein